MITYTQDDLDALKEALLTGASQVTVNGRTIIYRSKKELMELIGMIEDQLSGNTNLESSTTVVVGGFSRKGNCNE